MMTPRRSLAAVLATIAAGALLAPAAHARPLSAAGTSTAMAAVPVTSVPCQTNDMRLVKVAPYTRKTSSGTTLTLDYAQLLVYKATYGGGARYCVIAASEFRRAMWYTASSSAWVNGAWRGVGGSDWESLGVIFGNAQARYISAGNRETVYFKLRTASGTNYQASSGWLTSS